MIDVVLILVNTLTLHKNIMATTTITTSTNNSTGTNTVVSTNFKSWYRGQKELYKHFLSSQDMLMMNILCNAYHAGFGYSLSEEYTTDEWSPIYLGQYVLPEVITECVTSLDSDKPEYFLSIDIDAAREYALKYTLGHKTIRIRGDIVGECSWRSKPEDTKCTWFDDKDVLIDAPVPWYELPSRTTEYNHILLGALSDRQYIHVTVPYEEIEISSEDKGSPITIDDVLFACRGLCCGPDRSVSEFQVLSDDGSTLLLMADIDNWST